MASPRARSRHATSETPPMSSVDSATVSSCRRCELNRKAAHGCKHQHAVQQPLNRDSRLEPMIPASPAGLNGDDGGDRRSRRAATAERKGVIDMDQKNLDIYGSEPILWSRPLEEL